MNKMCFVRFFPLTFFLGLTLFFTVASVGAEFTVRSGIELIQEYNDNIFLEKKDKNSDFITRIIPSVRANYRAPFWTWQFDYALNWWYYHKLGKSFDSHSLDLTSKLNIIDNFLHLDIKDSYANIALDERRASNEDNLNVNRTDTNKFTASPYITYRITPVITLTTGYRYADIWHREESAIDRKMHTGYATIDKVFSPVFNASVGVEYTLDRPENPEPDNKQTLVFVKAVYNLSPRTDLNGSVGYRMIDITDGDNKKSLYYSFRVVHQFHQTGNIELKISSDVLTSATYGVNERRSEHLTIRYGEALKIIAGIFHRKSEYSETDSEDEAFGITTGLEYRPDPRLTFRLGGSFEKNKFMPEDETREVFRGTGEIAYKLARKASLIFRDTYIREKGRISNEDYKNNIIAVQLRIAI